MKVSELLQNSTHRPWPLPHEKWKFYQEWNKALFLHWEVEENELRKWVPSEIEIDLFEGKPWVSLVAFTMNSIRPRLLPALAPISDFHEINIRTYVKYKGKPAVYFLSIEGGKRLSCWVAKTVSELPYRYSNIKRNEGEYRSENSEFGDKLDLRFTIGSPVLEKEPIDLWLTERYALVQNGEKSINQFEIHHVKWPVRQIILEKAEITYRRFSSLFSGNPDKVNYSEGVQVVAWGKNQFQK